MNRKSKVVASLVVLSLICSNLVGCGDNTDNSEVASGAAVSGPSITASPILNEQWGYHDSNLDIKKHTVAFSVPSEGGTAQVELAKTSAFTFKPDFKLEVTGDRYTVLVQKQDEVVGSIHFDDMASIDVNKVKKYSFEGQYIKYNGYLLSEIPTKVPTATGEAQASHTVYIDNWTQGTTKCKGQLYIECMDKETLEQLLTDLQYSDLQQKFLNVEKEVMVYLVGGGTLTFTLPKDNNWYMLRYDPIETTEKACTFGVCSASGTVCTTVYYTEKSNVYAPHDAQDWEYDAGNGVILKGVRYAETVEDDIDYEYDGEHTYWQVVLTDIISQGKSVYRGQMIFSASHYEDIETTLKNWQITYAAG